MSLIKQPSELNVCTTIKTLVYGQPGVGKSSIALSAPKAVLFDFDNGIQRVNGAFQVPTVQITSWQDCVDALKEDLSPFRTIVIDTAGKMLDFMSAYIIKNDSKLSQRDGSLSLKGYGVRKNLFVNFIKQVSLLGKHIIFVAHEKEEKDGDTRIVRPEIGGSSSNDLIKELDLVGYMQMFGNERVICWTPTEKFYAKNTCHLPSVMKIDTNIDENGKVIKANDTFSVVFNQYHQYLKEQRDLTQKYQDVLDTIKSVLNDVKTAEDCNKATADIVGMEHIWDSKVKGATMLNKKAQELGFKFNKVKKVYE